MAESKPLWRWFKEQGIDPQKYQLGPGGLTEVNTDDFSGLQPPKTPVPGGKRFSNDPNAGKGASRSSQGNGRREDGN